MLNVFATLILLVTLANLSFATSCQLVANGTSNLAAVTRFANARVVGSRIAKGMTQKEADQIVGCDATVFLAPSEPKPLILYSYYKIGVNVYYVIDKDEELRVEKVCYWPLHSFQSPVSSIGAEDAKCVWKK